MNILDYLPEIEVSEEQLSKHAELVLTLREQTFDGFCAIEREKGGIDPSYPLYTTQGQNNVRQLFARTMEELFESDESESREHRLEELIDALNFGLSLLFLGNWINTVDDLWRENLLHTLNETPSEFREKYPDLGFANQLYDLGSAFSPLLAKLRNRTWQNQAQQPYFGGNSELVRAVAHLYGMVVSNFQDVREFLLYFIAKDMVLKFRIASKY